MYHLFHHDYLNGQLFDVAEEDYNERLLEITVVVAFCDVEIQSKAKNWVFQYDFTTCEGCKADYALSLLADLP